MQEYWVNVYWYPKNLLGPYLSNSFDSKEKAIRYGSVYHNQRRLTIYRIHVKMKELPATKFKFDKKTKYLNKMGWRD